jgi:hypothetical protein
MSFPSRRVSIAPRPVLAGLIALMRGGFRVSRGRRADAYRDLPDTAPFTMPPDD